MESVIVSAVRTPVGSFQGSLASLRAPELGAIAIKEAIRRAGLDQDQVDEVIMGNVLAAGIGQNPARQACILAGLSEKTCCMTINKVCGSGLKAVMLADQMIQCGDAEIVVAGGQESMSQVPYLLPKAREGYRMGDAKVVDAMIYDGLLNIYDGRHMGNITELCSREYNITREAQDQFAAESYRRAQKAVSNGKFKDEITPVEVPQRKGDPIVIDTDEEPGRGKIDKLPNLRAAFEKDGTVTAGNASSINDGAAAVVLMSEQKAQEIGLKPLVRIKGHAGAALQPEWFTIAPSEAVKNVWSRMGIGKDDIDLFEINEAFSAVSLVNNQILGLNPEIVNVNGGAVAIGHPIGASGARILVTLLFAMKDRNAKTGLASLCIGGGEGVAMVVERP
jgi:acetyl-CoA C-acetyltransferase